MRKRTAIVLVLASVFAVNVGTATVEASWLSKTLKKLDNALGVPDSNTQVTQQSDGYLHLPQVGDRWILVSQNKYYNTYLDRTKTIAGGEAQNRFVQGVFKREFTPLGSQKLGAYGKVKPDTVTVEYYFRAYDINSVGGGSLHRGYIPEAYYDVHGNLLWKGNSIEDKHYGNYIPESEDEHIKDRLFHMFGWDY